MNIVNPNSVLLSNLEVISFLKDVKEGKNGQFKPGVDQNNLATITYEVLKYFENEPCCLQTSETVHALMNDFKKFKLTKAEKLQLVNTLPRTAVEIQLLVEESEERLTVEEIDQLIKIIAE
ncbi:hypothetical protein HELRODRAFT_146448, partial [Helobdella robusta]|uniref:DNA-directed RNA polymerase III subunit RPC9 n=1 Tax=Helobdella robusta TaxID=6412 RepID=T1EJS3_HELRO